MPEPYVEGVTGTTIRPKRPDTTLRPVGEGTIRNPKKFAENQKIINEYSRQRDSLEYRKEEKKDKGPAWKRIASPVAKAVGKALEYTSGSELAYKIPKIGDDLEAAADYVPGVRTALAIATNPITYATGGTGAGLAAAAGAGLGTFALSDRERGLGLDIPGVEEKYEEAVGGALGGLAGASGMRSIRVRNAKAAAANAEANIQRMEQGALQADDVLHTADGKNFFPRRVTADAPDDPLDWYSVRIKNPANYTHNADELAWRHKSAGVADDAADAAEAVADSRPLSQAAMERLAAHADDADVISTGVKNSGGGGKNFFEKVGDVAQQTIMPPGFKHIRRLDRGIGQAVGKLAPDAVEPVVSALARPSVAMGLGVIADPQGAKDIVKKVFEIDKKIGLAIARKTLPKTDWDLGVAGLHSVNVEGVGAELFRPTNFINFSPAGMGLKTGMKLGSIAAAKQLGKRAILEGAGNAALMGVETWVNGGSVEDIAMSMGIGFGAGAVLPVGMDVAGHHLRPIIDQVRASATPEIAAARAAEFGEDVNKALDETPEELDPQTALASTTREPTEPLDGDGWVTDTFDGTPRVRVQKNQYGEIWLRNDDTYDFVDSRLADIKNGATKGAGNQWIRNFQTVDEAFDALEELTARFSKSPEARLADFQRDAGEAIEEADTVRAAEDALGYRNPDELNQLRQEAERIDTERDLADTPDIVRQAQDIAGDYAEQQDITREAMRPGRRAVTEAEAVSREAQANAAGRIEREGLEARKPRNPNPAVRESARAYNEAAGLPSIEDAPYVPVDLDQMRQVSEAFDAIPENFDDLSPAARQETEAAYSALRNEVEAQWRQAEADGMRFEFTDTDPYKSYEDVLKDVRENKHMFVFKGGDEHPLLGASTRDDSGLTANEKFRAIHDYYGHTQEGYGFDMRGEENAWIKHSQMFTPEAQRALSTETRGQNAWGHVNSPEDEFMFPTQKVGLLPQELTDWKRVLQERQGRTETQAPAPSRVAQTDSGIARTSSTASSRVEPFELESSPERLDAIVRRTIDEGGSSTDVRTGNNRPFDERMVSDPEYTNVFSPEEFRRNGADIIKNFISRNRNILDDENVVLGTWLDPETGNISVDVTRIAGSREEAVQRAIAGNQKATVDENGNIIPNEKYDPNKGAEAEASSDVEVKNGNLKGTPWETPEGTTKGVKKVVRGNNDKPSLLALDDGKTAKDIYGEAGKKSMREAVEDERAMIEELAHDAGESELPDVSPLSKSHGARYSGGKGTVAEVGNWLPDYVKTLPLYDGAKNSQVRVLGKMLAVELKYRGALSAKEQRQWFDEQVEKYGVDWRADGRTKGDVYARIKQQATIEINKVDKKLSELKGPDGKPFGIPNMARVLQLIHKGGPEAGQWYEGILIDSVQRFGYDDGIRFLNILAATSQQKAPDVNLRLALRAFSDYKLGYYENPNYTSPGLMGAVSDNVRAAIAGYEPLGRKINSFSQNLRLDDYAVTNDRWIFRIFGFADSETLATGKKAGGGSPATYEFVKGLVTRLSEDLGMTPREVQARLWVGARVEREGMTVSGQNLKSPNAAYENMWTPGHVDADEEAIWLRETIENMRDEGIIDIPDRAENAANDIERAIKQHTEPTEKFQAEVKSSALKKVRAEADSRGVTYTPDDDVVSIQTRIYEKEIPTGRPFTPTDAEADRNMVQSRMFDQPEMGSEIDSLIDKRAELEDFSKTGEITSGIARAVEEYENVVSKMTDDDIITALTIDQRTEAWQRRILEEARPDAAARAAEIGPERVIEVAKQRSVESRDFKPRFADETGAVRMKDGSSEALSSVGGRVKNAVRAGLDAFAEVEKTNDAMEGEWLRLSNASKSVGSKNFKGTYGDYADAISAEARRVLNSGEVITGTNKRVAATNSEHGWIVDELTDLPSMKEFSELSERTVKLIRDAYNETPNAPENMNVTYGGNLIDRWVFSDKGTDYVISTNAMFTTSPGARGAASGDAIIVNDILAMIRVGRTAYESLEYFKTGEPDVYDYIIKTIGEDYSEDDIIAGLFGHTMFHEMAHRTIIGHDDDFQRVLTSFREQHSGLLDTIVNDSRDLIQRWRVDGQFDVLKELSDDARRIDETHRRANFEPKMESTGVRDVTSSDIEAATGRSGDSRVPESVRGRVEEDVPSRDSGTERPQTATGTERGGTRAEGTGDQPRSRVVNRIKPGAAQPGGVRAQSTEKVGIRQVKRPKSISEAELRKNPDLEIIEKFRVVSDKVTIKDGGPGIAFLNARGAINKNKLVQELSNMEDVVEGNFIDNVMSRLTGKAVENKFSKALVKIIGGKAATAKTPWDKAIVGYHILLEEAESRKYLTLNWLKQSKLPFKEVIDENGVASGRVTITTKAGDEVLVNLDDVYSNPSQYKLTEGQRSYIETTHKIIDDLVAEMKANGVEIKELGVEKRGEHYFPRYVKGVEGFEPDISYVKRGLGAKANFLKTRQHATMLGGQKSGNIYARPDEALEVFFEQANRSIAGKKLLAALEPYGTTGKALALEQVGYKTIKQFNKKLGKEVEVKVFEPIYHATGEFRKAKKAVKQMTRELAAARKGSNKMKGGTGNRKLSMRELTSMANETPEVKAIRTSLEEAKARKAANKAGIDVQSPNDMKLEAAFKRAKDDYDRLLKRKSAYGKTAGHVTESPSIPKEQISAAHKKMVDARNALAADNILRLGSELNDTLASARAQIRAAHNIGRGANIGQAGKAIEDAQIRLDAAKEKLEAARLNFRKTAKEMRQITERLSSAQTVPQSVFGLSGDVIPVNAKGDIRLGRANVMALQGKLYPKEIADSLSDALNEASIGGVLRTVSDLNNKARLARASTDLGYLFIQGLPVLLSHPVAFAKAAHQAVRALFNPEDYARWLASKDAVTRDMYPFAGGFSGSEYFTATKGNFIKQAAELHGIKGDPAKAARKGIGITFQRFAVSFEAFLDGAKVNMWEGMMPHMKTRAEKEAYGRLLRNMTGTTNTARLGVSQGQRHAEALLMFSPRFTRSVFALAAQAMEGGPARVEALKSIGLMMTGAVVFYAGIKHSMYLAGYSDEDFSPSDLDPSQGGRFMSIKVGDNWIGLGGGMRGAIQLATNIGLSLKDPERFVSLNSTSNDKSNPFLKFARGKLSPFGSSAVDLAVGETIIGDDVSDRKTWLMRLPDQFLPFAAATMLETEGGINQKLTGLGMTGLGFRSFPESGYEDLNKTVRELSNDKDVEGWSSLTSRQKVEMLDKHPELKKLIDKAEVQNWNEYRELTDEYAKKKADLAARWIKTQNEHGGEKVTNDDLTSKEYRDQLERLNTELQALRRRINKGKAEFGEPKTGRQALMSDYYKFVDYDLFVRPDGTFDFEAKDAAESQFLSSLTEKDRKIVIEETAGTSADPLERRLKEARAELRPYWDLYDAVAQDMGYESRLAISSAPEGIQKRYDKVLTRAQETWRKQNPEADRKMAIWGYVSKTMDERKPGKVKRIKLNIGKPSKRVKRITVLS